LNFSERFLSLLLEVLGSLWSAPNCIMSARHGIELLALPLRATESAFWSGASQLFAEVPSTKLTAER
jgi:hypothetical protein